MHVKASSQFEKALDNILSCGRDVYSERIIKQFYFEYKRYRILLSSQPLMGSVEQMLVNRQFEYRKIVIKPFFKIIYCVVDECVCLVDIWDTRRSPDVLSKGIV